MREQLKKLRVRAAFYGTDLEEKDIDLRHILVEIIKLLDQALPKEVEPD